MRVSILTVSAIGLGLLTVRVGTADADLGDGKPMTPSAITVAIESCAKQAPDNGMDPTWQLAYCACVTDYMDGLKPKSARALAKGFETGELPGSFVKAAKKCATWSEKNFEKSLDRTPYSRKKVLSAVKTMEAYLRCEKTEAARSKGGTGAIEYCDKIVSSVRKQ